MNILLSKLANCNSSFNCKCLIKKKNCDSFTLFLFMRGILEGKHFGSKLVWNYLALFIMWQLKRLSMCNFNHMSCLNNTNQQYINHLVMG